MKNITELTEATLNQIIYCDLRTGVDIDTARDIILKALKTQDKTTGHNCAEAVGKVEGKNISDDEFSPFGGSSTHMIPLNKAHTACVNATGI